MRAASTNSLSRNASDWPRTRRATSIQRVNEKAMMMTSIPRGMRCRASDRTNTKINATSRSGIPYQMLMKNEITVSTDPR